MVVALKWAKSSGIRHGMPAVVADHAVVGVRRDQGELDSARPSDSDGDGGLDARVRVVALDRDVLEVERVDLGHRRVEPERRQRPRLAGQLEPRLLDVVGVEVGVAEGVHEVADARGRSTWATMWVSRA